MSKTAIKEAIIHTSRPEIRDAVRQELKTRNINKIINPANTDNCLEELVSQPHAMLFVDWEIGAGDVVKILQSIKNHHKVETRPIMMLAAKISDEVAATAYEFNVSKVHTGEISRKKIGEYIKEMIKAETQVSDLRELLVKVAEARKRDSWEVATPLLIEFLQSNPGNPRIIAELAENYIHEEQWEKARECLESIIDSMTPPHVRVLHLFGRCLMHEKRFQDAIFIMKQAKFLSPFNPERLVDLGNVLLKVGQLKEARENFQEAMNLDRKNKGAVIGNGKALLMEGDINEALPLLKEFSSEREIASVFNVAAIVAAKDSKFDQCMALYDAAMVAVNLEPKLKSRLWLNKGIGFIRWGKQSEAKGCFERASELDPDYEKAGRFAKIAASNLEKSSKGPKMPKTDTKEMDFDNDLPNIDFEDEKVSA